MSEAGEKEVLVVVSKLKNYIRSASGFNTSSAVADVVSDIIRALSDKAIERAKSEGRKTVMDRDFTEITTTAARSTGTEASL